MTSSKTTSPGKRVSAKSARPNSERETAEVLVLPPGFEMLETVIEVEDAHAAAVLALA
ncbi:hypothetical protein [Amycolatopsis keratiniphila]|uniref:hypothetical protein n=1 Tax=Amycolatopsis keratiniphila TaxID=129921 RepID=UPI001E551E16|nr:hypothetical protein [Amycolatopsis keratiniphila]